MRQTSTARSNLGVWGERLKTIGKTFGLMVLIGSSLATLSNAAETNPTSAPTEPASGRPAAVTAEQNGIWQDGLGRGFREHTIQSGFLAGAGFGKAEFGSWEAHDLALGSINAGYIITDVICKDHFFRGNLEVIGELFGGVQFHPETRYLTGLNALFRYNIATETRWVPFLTCGAGVTLTQIGDPDLSGTFQFDPQAGLGTHYFFRENVAFTAEWRWLHISNAGIKEPNNGVNTQMFMAGINWFF